MDKKEVYKKLGFVAMVALGTILGVTVLDFTKRQLLKNDFSKPLNVTAED